MSAERVATIAAVLERHEYALGVSRGGICVCGFVPDVQPETLKTQQDYHRAHVAAAIDAALSDERGGADVAARVEAVQHELWRLGVRSSTQRSYPQAVAYKFAAGQIRAALADPGALDRHDAEVKAAGLREGVADGA